MMTKIIGARPGEGSKASSAGHEHVNTDPYHFATWFADNEAATHLLELTRMCSWDNSYLNNCLGSTGPWDIGYKVSLAAPVVRPEGGSSPEWRPESWRIGAGFPLESRAALNRGQVELQLCPTKSMMSSELARQHLADEHAELFFHRESGMLMMRNLCDSPIVFIGGTPGGNSDLVLRKGDQGCDTCVLFQECNIFSFGPYVFSLRFREVNNLQYAELKTIRDKIMKPRGKVPSRHLLILPRPQPIIIGDFWLHKMLGKDLLNTVWSGVRLPDGRPLAVKKLKYNYSTANRVAQELRIAARFGNSSSGVLGLVRLWCEHGIEPPCQLTRDGLQPKAPFAAEDMFYSMPLAEHDFSSMHWEITSLETRLELFMDSLEGLGKIHDANLVHRAIRPSCLMILRCENDNADRSREFKTAIHSLGSASFNGSTMACKPTTPDYPWVAPEIYHSECRDPYTEKTDIWSLAFTWIYAFKRPKNEQAIPIDAIGLVEQIYSEGEITLPVRNLWAQMLHPIPKKRPALKEAMVTLACCQSAESKANKARGVGVGRARKRVRISGSKENSWKG